jgi:bacteriorhodopsin
MKIDALRDELRASEARAEKAIRVDAAKLRSTSFTALSAMHRLSAVLWVELALNVVGVLWLVRFLASHLGEPRFLIAAAVLQGAALAHVVVSVHQLTTLRRLDFGGPVVTIQTGLERLRLGRIRLVKWTLLLGPLLWIPLLMVMLEGLFGIDTDAADRTWLVGNVLFGLAFIPAMLWVSKRFADRFEGSPLVRRVLRDIAGRNLASALGALDELARLEAREEA